MVCVPYTLWVFFLCMCVYMYVITVRREGVAAGLNRYYVCFCVQFILLITLVNRMKKKSFSAKDGSVFFKYASGTVAWLPSYCQRAEVSSLLFSCRVHLSCTEKNFSTALQTEICWQAFLFTSISFCFLYIGLFSQHWLRHVYNHLNAPRVLPHEKGLTSLHSTSGQLSLI